MKLAKPLTLNRTSKPTSLCARDAVLQNPSPVRELHVLYEPETFWGFRLIPFRVSQRLQYPIIKEYTLLNYSRAPTIV